MYGTALVLLAHVEVIWLAWVLMAPLPYANDQVRGVREPIRRAFLLLNFFPGIIPELTWHQSGLGAAARKPAGTSIPCPSGCRSSGPAGSSWRPGSPSAP